MENKEELKEKLLSLLTRETSLSTASEALELSAYETLGLVKDIQDSGVNIVVNVKDDDAYLINQGDIKFQEENTYEFKTDKNNEFKFVLISDTRFGSTYQQLSILNDIYRKAYDMGYLNVIHCGNISNGLYGSTDPYNETCFLPDTQRQIDYIVSNYPKISGLRTYFITGKLDDKHLKDKKINIGKRIAELRDDMVYLGENSCYTKVDNSRMNIMGCSLSKSYTVSYRIQQQVDSYRSEDKPDILLMGGLLQMEKFTYRNVNCISVPSVCATTKKMNDKRYSNTVGAWFVTVKTNKYGKLDSVNAICSPYYVTSKDDYKNAKVMKLDNKKKGGK